MTAVQGEIDSAGNFKGTGLVNSYDYARLERCQSWATDKNKFKEEYFSKPYPSVHIQDFSINNVDADSLQLEQKVNFTSSLNKSGGYSYFSVNLFSNLETNPFIAEKRISDIDFGVPQLYTIFGNYSIPPGFSFDGLPENISMSTPDHDIEFNRISKAEDNLLNVRVTVEFKRSFYPASDYGIVKEFYKKMIDKLAEQVVIKKNSTP